MNKSRARRKAIQQERKKNKRMTAEQLAQLKSNGKIIAESKLKQIEKLKLEVMARNPMITGIPVPPGWRGSGLRRMKVQAWVEILEE